MRTESAPQDLSVYVPEKVRRPGEIGFAVLGTLIGVLGYYFAMGMTSDSYSAPSVFPKIASAVITACGAASLAKAIKRAKPPANSGTLFQFLLPGDVLFMLAMLVVYCLALPKLHFILSSYAFMVVGMVWLHRGKKILQSLIISAGTLAVLVAVFRYVFLVILP
ncbi:MAG: tripartite tricarboxylate transporter TctB family protein [Synergistaceae bacterium]|nr:tripartite tricarboxylate transporter TctB family protein [Synergistaceae bacterium]